MKGHIQNILSDKSCRNIWMKILKFTRITMFYFVKDKICNKWIIDDNNKDDEKK